MSIIDVPPAVTEEDLLPGSSPSDSSTGLSSRPTAAGRRLGRPAAGVVLILGLVIPATPSIAQSPTEQQDTEEPTTLSTADGAPPALLTDDPVLNEWTATRRVFETEVPGTFATQVFAEPVNLRGANGTWRAVDATLNFQPVDEAFQPARTAIDTSIAADPSSDSLVRVELEDQASISFGLEGAAGPDVDSEDVVLDTTVGVDEVAVGYPVDIVPFDAILPGVDLEVSAMRDGVKETIVLAGPSSPRNFTFDLDLQGLTAALNELGEIEYLHPDGSLAAITPIGFMEDSSRAGMMGSVSYELSGPATDPMLHIRLDSAWLDEPERTWPVRVDPTLYKPDALNDDTFVLSGWPANWSAHPELRTGSDTAGQYKYRSFMHFGMGTLDGKVITDASLRLWGVYSPACTSNQINLFRVTQAWTGSGLTQWLNQPSATQLSQEMVPGFGHSGCNNNGAYVTFDGLARTVQRWVDGIQPSLGLSLRSESESNSNAHRRFSSSSAPSGSIPPHLLIYWENPPTAPSVSATAGTAIDAPETPELPVDTASTLTTLGDGSITAEGASGSAVELPATTGEDVVLPAADGSEVRIGLPDMGGSTPAEIEGDLVVYRTDNGGADIAVEPLDGGARTMIVLAGAGSESEFYLPLELPEGATVEPDGQGGATIVSHDVSAAEAYLSASDTASQAWSPDPDPSDSIPQTDSLTVYEAGIVDAIDNAVELGVITQAEANDLLGTVSDVVLEVDPENPVSENVSIVVPLLDDLATALGTDPPTTSQVTELLTPTAPDPEEGSTSESLEAAVASEGVPLGYVGLPWATDAAGNELVVSQSVTETGITVSVDTETAVFPVVVDPTYWTLICRRFGDYKDARTYIRRLRPWWCPRSWLLFGVWSDATGRNYMPTEALINQADALRAVRRSGGCGFIPDTGPFYDFQVPCKAHDYCYDLVRFAMPRVREHECNNVFQGDMTIHCNHWGDGLVSYRDLCRRSIAAINVPIRINSYVNPILYQSHYANWRQNHIGWPL